MIAALRISTRDNGAHFRVSRVLSASQNPWSVSEVLAQQSLHRQPDVLRKQYRLMNERATVRFKLVSAAHRFALQILRGQKCNVIDELSQFLTIVSSTNLPTPDIDSVLLRTLGVVSDGHRLLTLPECYLARRRAGALPSVAFDDVVRGAAGVRHSLGVDARQVMAIVDGNYFDPALTTKVISKRVGRPIEVIASDFFAWLHMYPSEYLRNVRLDHAVTLLTSERVTVKEIWVAVGYKHASNFDHDFKKRFGVSPRECRASMRENLYPAAFCQTQCTVEAEAAEAPRVRRGRPLLIVDDDGGTRDTIGHYLMLEGYSVTVACTAAEAIAAASQVKLDAMLLDYWLPDMNGLECLRMLRRRGLAVPIVVFTADWELEERSEELARLGAAVLLKLCELSDLTRAVESCLTH